MKRLIVGALGLIAIVALVSAGTTPAAKSTGPAWNMNASVIEACSCPMFCQCYFNTQPSAHAGHEGHGTSDHFCKFNNAYKINKGQYGSTKLDGAKFWIYGDLGGDFSQGHMDWAVVTFDKAMTKEQRDAVAQICGHLFPVHWNSLKTAEGDITWMTPSKDEAYALLDGGKSAEVRLNSANLNRDDKGKQIVLSNMKYWGATSNDGFVMMPNTVEALHVGDQAFEYKGTNGFFITINIDSKTAPPAMTGM